MCRQCKIITNIYIVHFVFIIFFKIIFLYQLVAILFVLLYVFESIDDVIRIHIFKRISVQLCSLKTIAIAYLYSIDFCYVYIYCRKFNAEFNKLIKTEGHRACFLKNDVEHTHLRKCFLYPRNEVWGGI